jgi:hypothetical protein
MAVDRDRVAGQRTLSRGRKAAMTTGISKEREWSRQHSRQQPEDKTGPEPGSSDHLSLSSRRLGSQEALQKL